MQANQLPDAVHVAASQADLSRVQLQTHQPRPFDGIILLVAILINRFDNSLVSWINEPEGGFLVAKASEVKSDLRIFLPLGQIGG